MPYCFGINKTSIWVKMKNLLRYIIICKKLGTVQNADDTKICFLLKGHAHTRLFTDFKNSRGKKCKKQCS